RAIQNGLKQLGKIPPGKSIRRTANTFLPVEHTRPKMTSFCRGFLQDWSKQRQDPTSTWHSTENSEEPISRVFEGREA
ncbi:MAG TPA: hypothetical protein VGR14_18980, partial [Verrucomicrobiae bacterium]|nr:hypothetical protein [Verrucomicrobiae bacterium]